MKNSSRNTEIHRLYKMGAPISKLMKAFDMSERSILEITKVRVDDLKKSMTIMEEILSLQPKKDKIGIDCLNNDDNFSHGSGQLVPLFVEKIPDVEMAMRYNGKNWKEIFDWSKGRISFVVEHDYLEVIDTKEQIHQREWVVIHPCGAIKIYNPKKFLTLYRLPKALHG